MKAITIFSWGYKGWGNATTQLITAVDAVERGRGFEAPIFVDIRLRREVRAEGFKGRRFENKVGAERYHWMDSLGNKAIADKSDRMKIADPKTAADLLRIALDAAKDKQRVLFFCRCQRPKHNLDDVTCHRTAVARLLLNVANKENVPIEVVEWPGGKPKPHGEDITAHVQQPWRAGRRVIPLKRTAKLAKFAGLPWGNVVSFAAGEELIHRITGPAIYHQWKWCLPVIDWFEDPNVSLQDYRKASFEVRKYYGYESCMSF